MIEFMLLAAPRSGTTWASNWLTTDTTLCLHDPLYRWHYDDLDKIASKRVLGVSCTGLALFGDWVNNHPARKVILHRDLADINRSLADREMTLIGPNFLSKLDKIKGMHVHWQDLFDDPAPIYEHLLQLPFDEERHREIKAVFVEPKVSEIKVNIEANRRLLAQMRGLL